METFLSNKTAIVTGGTKGIGRAIVEALARAGASVSLCGRTEDTARQAAKEVAEQTGAHVLGNSLDVRDEQAVKEYFESLDSQFEQIDVLVNNAGIGIFSPVAELTFQNWKDTLETNLSGVFYCCREALPRMKKSGGGAIVNISSLAAKNPFAGGAAYNASKFGLNGFSEAMMLDHRKDKIRVTSIMPGSVDTDFGRSTERADWKIAPEDVAEVVLAVLRMPERTTISRVEIRPSIPPG